MKIVTIKIDSKIMQSIKGRFHHVSGNNVKALLIGGAAREILLASLNKTELGVISDFDFSFVKVNPYEEAYYSKDMAPRGQRRIEVEWDAPHATIQDLFRSRDFTINQVAIDSKGNCYATKMGLLHLQHGIIYPVGGQTRTLTDREILRATRFSYQYKAHLDKRILHIIRKYLSSILENEEHLYDRYCNEHKGFKEYINSLN